jgi:predicted GNAT family acetyltransferase
MADPQPSTHPVSVADAPDRRRFEASIDGELAGFARYVRLPDRVVFTHTEVDPAFEGRGVGSALAKGALDAMRANGDRVEARCPFIAAYIKRHPDYADLLATAGTPAS